jgi:hypothetical protein
MALRATPSAVRPACRTTSRRSSVSVSAASWTQVTTKGAAAAQFATIPASNRGQQSGPRNGPPPHAWHRKDRTATHGVGHLLTSPRRRAEGCGWQTGGRGGRGQGAGCRGGRRGAAEWVGRRGGWVGWGKGPPRQVSKPISSCPVAAFGDIRMTVSLMQSGSWARDSSSKGWRLVL